MPWPDRKVQKQIDEINERFKPHDDMIGIAVNRVSGLVMRRGANAHVATGSYLGAEASPLLAECKPVCLQDDGTVYKEISKYDVTKHIDGSTVNLTGANGQMMEQNVAGYERHAAVGDWVICDLSHVPLSGFSLAKAFPGKKSFYVGMFEGSRVPGTSLLSSIALDPRDGSSPVWPLTSRTTDEWGESGMTSQAMYALAAARGPGWTTQKYQWWKWRRLLQFVAFGSLNAQEYIGNGRTGLSGGVWKRDTDDSNTGYIGRCGLSNSLVGPAVSVYNGASGFLTDVSRTLWVENDFGNCWEILVDVLVDSSDINDVRLYYKDDPPYSFTDYTGYTVETDALGNAIILPAASGYKGAPVAGALMHSLVSNGLSTKFTGDYYWIDGQATPRSGLVGANSAYGSSSGAAAWRSSSAASHSYAGVASRAGFQEAA